ncbi:MAG: phage holin family protein [Oscillospiraceae bacterium]|nr:phage holin family protein [Oscillospiraceae bacterium]
MLFFQNYFYTMTQNAFVQLVALAVALDTVMGCLRALMHHDFNSSFGINGAIRKFGIIASVTFLMLVDNIMNINLIGFIPAWAQAFFKAEVEVPEIGIGGFFCLLYIAYEAVSILKNWYILGLPSPPVFKTILEKFLGEVGGSGAQAGAQAGTQTGTQAGTQAGAQAGAQVGTQDVTQDARASTQAGGAGDGKSDN